MVKLTIDNVEVEVPAGTAVIQACEQVGIEIPRFCYHERLAIAGNCRMCLVEVSPGPPKPQASCALPVAEGMVVKTNTPMVKKAREGVMEFLLINHPLDCPICDQGGECDLQDQAMAYGTGKSRYHEHKRAVEDKYMGPLIKTQMTRCIHCTRCIRFATDIAGVPELGATGRGEHMEITTYVEKAITSELSGNLVDLCPVGALTSKPYAFLARPWELKKTESIDVMDAMGSAIRIDSRGEAVLRILPRLNEDVNEEWISDKTRHACDGLRTQRIDRPYVRKAGKLTPVRWDEAFAAIAERVAMARPERIAALAGDLVDVESMVALKELMTAIGSPHLDCRQDGAFLPTANRGDYLFNSGFAGIEKADAILLIGANPRLEAPVLNARIRKVWSRGQLKHVHALGATAELTYPTQWHGANPAVLNEWLKQGHPALDALKNAQNPLVIIGMGALARPDGAAIYAAARAIADKVAMRDGWNGFNVLHSAAARVGGLDTGFVPSAQGRSTAQILEGCRTGDVEVLYLLGVDEIDTRHFGNAFVIYQGHHGDQGAHRADVVLPGAAYTEKDATYVNSEGRVQRVLRAVFPPGEAKEDWAILRALSAALGRVLPYDSLEALRAHMARVNPVFATLDAVQPAAMSAASAFAPGAIDAAPLEPAHENFYMTDPISRASKTMAECTASARDPYQKAA